MRRADGFTNRGANKARPSRKPQTRSDSVSVRSATAEVAELGKYYEFTEGLRETVADHVIPRKSLTDQQFLRLFEPAKEFEFLHGTHHVKDGQPVYVGTSDGRIIKGKPIVKSRLTWKGDRTLLDTSKPQSRMPANLYRQKSPTSRIEWLGREDEDKENTR